VELKIKIIMANEPDKIPPIIPDPEPHPKA